MTEIPTREDRDRVLVEDLDEALAQIETIRYVREVLAHDAKIEGR